MERLMGIAFWIVTFSVTLACCCPVHRDHNCSKLHYDINEFNIELMNETVKCQNDSQFYIPQIIQNTCCICALECIFKELKGTVLEECTDEQNHAGSGLDTLSFEIEEQKQNKNITASTKLQACVCEKWSNGSFIEFLKGYKSLLTSINAGASR